MKKYSADYEVYMRRFSDSLNEKDRRHYAAMEAMRLGHGGKKYIAEIMGISLKTINSGIEELKKTHSHRRESDEKAGGGSKQT